LRGGPRMEKSEYPCDSAESKGESNV
jgi:hypothetical protein